MSLRKSTEGAVFVEYLIAVMPVFTLTLCIFQQTVLFAGQLLTEHAALSAVRAASVVIPDDPSRYGGEGPNTAGQKRKEAIRLAAIRALGPLVQDENITSVEVDLGASPAIGAKSPITVRVDTTFQCKVVLASTIVCDKNGQMKLSAQATMPNQGANYTYEN